MQQFGFSQTQIEQAIHNQAVQDEGQRGDSK
jgi:hypothetical protein